MKYISQMHSLSRRIGLLLHRWHRRIGVLVSLFVIWMVVSGWLLNHTAALDLAHRMVTADIITTRYGLHSDLPTRAFIANNHWLIAGNDAFILDGKKIALSLSQPLGLVINNNVFFIADVAQLILLDSDGAMIDKVATPLVDIVRMGNGCDGVVIANKQKQLMTKDGIAWSDCDDAVQWAHTENLTPAQYKMALPLLHPGISIERLLLDLHSGRFFGIWGPYFVDTVGLGMLLLALSGVWLFARHRRRAALAERQHTHR